VTVEVGTLEVQGDEQRLVAALIGEIDIACSDAISAELVQLLDRDIELVVLDLSRTTYIDSSGIRMIFSLARSLEASNRQFRLVVSDEAIVRRVVILSRLDAAIPIFSALEDALSPTAISPMGSLTLQAASTSPRAARNFVRGVLEQSGLSDATVEDAVLATNELVTNAVLHARTECTVRIEQYGEVIRVEVEDRDVTPPRPNLDPEPAMASGRGLILIEQVAVEWGHEPLPDGKIVWCEVRRSA
jgi:anti-anti-sigma factor